MMRVSGMYSGLDTESLIREMTAAYSAKKEVFEKQKTSLEWKQESWNNLNKELYNFYSSTLSNIKFDNDNNYNTKYSSDQYFSITNPNKNNVGTYNIQVKELAQAGYLTGAEMTEDVTADTAIEEILKHPHVGSVISINNTSIEVTDDMTVGQLVAEIAKVSDIKANYDEKNHRIFIQSTKTGKVNDFKIDGDKEILKALGLDSDNAVKIDGKDAELIFNGATFTSSSNNFDINGVNIEVKQQTERPVNVTVESNSTQADKIINFIKLYNEALERMQTAYNKPSAKTYMPLSESEKDKMSDKAVEKWEEKGKENILSKDSSLATVINIFKEASMKSYDINGQKVSLASIGITTDSYFTTTADKRGTLNVDENKLKESLNKDPDMVNNLLKAFGTELYEKLGQNSKSNSLRSVYKFYNDKEMDKQLKEYEKKIKSWEDKVTKMEDKYYKQFAAMEKAMAQMQSRSDALSGWFGGK